MSDIAYLEFNEIAAPKLAVDGEIEQGEISKRSANCGRIRIAQISRSFNGASARLIGSCSTDCG